MAHRISNRVVISRRALRRYSMNEFEEFDPTQDEQFEDFDVMSEAEVEAEAAITMETLGALSESRDELQALVVARDEAENRLMGPAGVQAAALSDEEPYDPANVVGVGIA